MSDCVVPSAEYLVDLAVDRPGEALARADAVLGGPSDGVTASYAHQARGIVLRDSGRIRPARQAFRAALRSAPDAVGRRADILASLAVAEVLAGRTVVGLRTFADAVALATGPQRARVLVRHGTVLFAIGRFADAVAELTVGIEECRRHGQDLELARAWMARSMALLPLGSTAAADRDAARAHAVFVERGRGVEAAKAVHNRGLVAFRSGRLVAALALLDEAESRYSEVGLSVLMLAHERCTVFAAAGLAQDALLEADAALALASTAADRAELLVSAASAALDAGQPTRAADLARQAERSLRAQSRPAWAARARLLALSAEAASGPASATLRRRAAALARQFTRDGALEAAAAHLLAGRLHLGIAPQRAADHLTQAATLPAPTAGDQVTRQLARALLARADGRPARVARLCTDGLLALDRHRLGFGSLELQALAGSSGRELREVALATVLAHGSARDLLRMAERTRWSPVSAGPSDEAGQSELAALRDVSTRLVQARAQGAATPTLEREQAVREQQVRRRQRLLSPGESIGWAAGLDLPALITVLGSRCLIELVVVGDELHAVILQPGRRTARVRIGSLQKASVELGHARFALRRATYGRPVDLADVGRRLQDAVLGPVADRPISDDGVIVVPPATLPDVPWGLLPALADRTVTVSPSAALWLNAARQPAPVGAVVLVGGPDVYGDELPVLQARHPDAIVLTGTDATASRVLAALDGARLAHIAAHGSFRPQNPLFSGLRLYDGTLTGYDLQGLGRAPHRVVLAACHSGSGARVGDDAVLGLASVLVGRGCGGLLAPVAEVDDRAGATVALDVHAALADGDGLPGALRRARRNAHDGPTTVAAALFTAVGV